jgi:mono/diheme cytochrome c family protein
MAAAVAGLAAAAPPPAAAQQRGDSGTVASILDGAFTAAQAVRGQAAFRNACASCHSTSEYYGPAFQRRWAGQPVLAFFEQVRTSMPPDNPGGLSRAEYAAILAYILQLNSYPEGSAELPAEDAKLRTIRFEVRPSG